MVARDSSGIQLVEANTEKAIFRIHRNAYKSAEVFAMEKEKIFSKCWLYLGHESEVTKNSDYITRRVGGRDLIFVRDRTGKVNAFYNSCTHRGAKVVRETRGNRKTYACDYHGWVFNPSGKLLSTSTEHGYKDDINEGGRLDLLHVARLENYRGFYFVNYNPKAISLYDYLDGARDALDTLCDQTDTRLVIMPGEHAYSTKANYKYLAENSYDGYHLPVVHASYMDFLRDRVAGNEVATRMVNDSVNAFARNGRARGLGNGHAILDSLVPTGRPVAQWNPVWGPEVKKEIDAKRAWMESKLGKERSDYIADYQKNLVIFPNLVINDIMAATIRVIEPESHNFMRVTGWAIAPEEESAALRKIRMDNFISFLGPAGFGSPDDIEMLELCQQGIEHSPIEWTEMSKGYGNAPDARYADGPPDDEVQIQAYWTQWDRVMRDIDSFEVKA